MRDPVCLGSSRIPLVAPRNHRSGESVVVLLIYAARPLQPDLRLGLS